MPVEERLVFSVTRKASRSVLLTGLQGGTSSGPARPVHMSCQLPCPTMCSSRLLQILLMCAPDGPFNPPFQLHQSVAALPPSSGVCDTPDHFNLYCIGQQCKKGFSYLVKDHA